MVMAPAPFSISSLPLLFLLFCSYDSKVHGDDQGFELLREETLMPATVCSTLEAPSDHSLKVVHRHGPCSPSGDGQPDHLRILSQDSLRVAYIQNGIQLANASGNTNANAPLGSSASLQARDGYVIGSDSYVVTVGIGTPTKTQTVIFDTGSNLCWIQCKPCRSCYQQREPIFDPSASSSYHNVACNDPACTRLPALERNCSANRCVYRVLYEDSSTTIGFLSREKLMLTPATVIPNFVFGCGQTNRGFNGVAGVLGLGRTFHSLASQASGRFGDGNVFSYCLPSSSSNTGHLTIGSITARSVPSYTPMLPSRPDKPGQYFIDLLGISVAGQLLRVSPSVFQRFGTIIDSGTMISRLPRAAYTELRNAFRSSMSRYRLVAPASILDTCYDFSNVRPLFPQITLHFTGASYRGVNLVLTQRQVFFVVSAAQVCLAFAPTNANDDIGILGSIQQRGMDVIYDVGARKIGFAAGHCS